MWSDGHNGSRQGKRKVSPLSPDARTALLGVVKDPNVAPATAVASLGLLMGEQVGYMRSATRRRNPLRPKELLTQVSSFLAFTSKHANPWAFARSAAKVATSSAMLHTVAKMMNDPIALSIKGESGHGLSRPPFASESGHRAVRSETKANIRSLGAGQAFVVGIFLEVASIQAAEFDACGRIVRWTRTLPSSEVVRHRGPPHG